jgi:serine/threonine protein kinase
MILLSMGFITSLNIPLSHELKDLIGRMLVVNPLERISISEILKHPWIQHYDTILEDQDYLINGGDITLHSFDDSANPNPSSCLAQPDSFTIHISSNALLNTVNVDNLYKQGLMAKQRLSYADYCAITQDHATMNLNEGVL